MKKLATTKPPVKILYRPTCLQDGPDNTVKSPRQRPWEFTSMLLIRLVTGEGRSRRVKHDVMTFTGDTREEADQKQAEWIEASGAIEDDPESQS